MRVVLLVYFPPYYLTDGSFCPRVYEGCVLSGRSMPGASCVEGSGASAIVMEYKRDEDTRMTDDSC